ncbi:MAG: radical SAM family heme chaperone HemW, partial [Gammaproteobacteria bacterium]|nr:radical SAM family heme chaperone HemW [Gammaproteobacteria bacterium]
MLELPPLGLYVHIPWCVRKCPYCDFNSHERPGAGIPEAAYVEALCGEIALNKKIRLIETVFFGGGTPSLFQPESFARLLGRLAERKCLAPEAEITLEANPGIAEAGRFAACRAAGINRLSIGVQSFDDAALARLGRIHGGADARAAFTIAREAGFDNINLDLMFGLPRQSQSQALSDLETAIALAPEHISWYQLTLEPNTVFWRRPPRLPPEHLIDTTQEAGIALLESAGYARYEVSAFARPGKACRHNLNYWRFGDYLGIGAGAHGKLT